MTEISCDICMDLIPLVRDGVASTDSEAAVRYHIDHCPYCKKSLEGELPQNRNSHKVYHKLIRHIRIMALLILCFGLSFGLSLSGGENMFYNIWLMPIIGAIGYGLFRWKAIWCVPLFVIIAYFIMNALGILWVNELMQWSDVLIWSLYYSFFVILGTIIAGLFHFAFKKEK